jgi:hypothetical protein
MSHRLSPLQFIAVVTGVMLLVLVALVQLPHDRYIRFQHMAAQSVHYLRAQWIYERIHFDETPIDIAFIGTSHTQCSINAELVEQGLSAAGHPQHVVNFAIPALGRDLHYLLVRELLENRSIKTLVIEVQEGESRAPHPAFDLLSEARDLFTGPLIVNSRFPETLAGLPLRQATLFVQSRFPELFGVAATFNPATYQARWDDTYQIRGFNRNAHGCISRRPL